MKPDWQNAPQWANWLADMLTYQQFIRKHYPNYSWAKKKMFPKDLITLKIADLFHLMDKWAEYKISGHVEDPSIKHNLNVGGGGFLDPE